MRVLFRLPVLVLLAPACGAPVGDDVDDTDDAVAPGTFVDADGDGISDQAVTVSQCSEGYTIPGPLGTLLEDAVQPHEAVFGEEQELFPGMPERGRVGPDPVHLHLGWPGEDTSTSISFVWSTDTGTLASQVQIAEGAGLSADQLGTTFDGVTYAYGGATNDAYRIHELKLCGRLKPGTAYSYRVGGEGHWSDVHTFTTPGAPGSFDAFTAVILGDSRGAYEDWAQIVQAAEAHGPDLYLFSGDAVQLGSNQYEWHAWWEAAGDVFAEKVIVPAHGNHEALSTNYFAQFSLPAGEQWFSLRYGPMALLSLNDWVADEALMAFDQPAFMDEHLDADAPWKVALHHRATYSVCDNHGSAEEVRGYWESTFEDLGVDLVLAGHNHIYERSVPIAAGAEAAPGEGIVYLVSGGAGADLYKGVDPDWFNEVVATEFHYVVADFDAEGAQITVKGLDGDELDSFYVPRE